MKNRYVLKEYVAIVFLKRRSGKDFQMVIDREDVDELRKLDVSIFAVEMRSGKKRGVYHAMMRVDGKMVYVHRYLRKCPEGYFIEHLDGDTLNNRKRNLRIISSWQKSLKREGRNNFSSGVKGVSWHKPTGKWRARIKKDGKAVFEEYFENRHDAIEAVLEKRKALLCSKAELLPTKIDK